MENLFAWINSVLKFVGPLSDFFWDIPTQFSWYKNLPLLGSFSFAIIVLVGSGIYFTLRLHCIQLTPPLAGHHFDELSGSFSRFCVCT